MKNKKILAILSSFLLALFFSLPWIICYIYFDLMLSALAIIIGYGAFKGYKMVSKEIDGSVIWIVTINSLLVVTFVTLFIIPLLLLNENGYQMSIENLKVLYSYNSFRSAIIKDYSISFIFTLLGISLPVSNIKKALMTNDNTDVDIKLINENTMLKNEIEYTRKIFEKKNAFSKNKTINKEIAIKEYDDFFSMIDGLYNGDVKAIILNEAYIDVIIETEGYEDFKDKVKELLMTEVKSKVEWYEQDDDSSIKLNSDVFTLYISGIDTYGSVAKTSRSDVNIIAVVNTKTKQILLVSTPRDYYVPLSISNGVKDKLTHAGLYGINCSKDTLSMIYDLDIQYYFRLNFDGFIKIIDKLGGVTVHSDYAFTTRSGHYNIQVGDNKLNGKEALAFARERYALADGDRQRGRDQMEVIKAVINEMASSKLLYNYTDIMDAISDCFQTSMPKDMIQSLVKMQINDMKKWNIVSCSADGTGTRSSTYSIPQRDNLWVMIPDESTIEHAKELIQQVIDGKIISE